MLALMHLRKVFTDFCRSHTSSSDYEQKLYRMVPLFVKVGLLRSLFLLDLRLGEGNAEAEMMVLTGTVGGNLSCPAAWEVRRGYS